MQAASSCSWSIARRDADWSEVRVRVLVGTDAGVSCNVKREQDKVLAVSALADEPEGLGANRHGFNLRRPSEQYWRNTFNEARGGCFQVEDGPGGLTLPRPRSLRAHEMAEMQADLFRKTL